MDDERIRSLLKELHSALGSAAPATDEDRELLEQLSADVEALLARPGAVTRAEHQSIADRLMSAVTRFEVTHPNLTSTMAQVSKSLGDMGI